MSPPQQGSLLGLQSLMYLNVSSPESAKAALTHSSLSLLIVPCVYCPLGAFCLAVWPFLCACGHSMGKPGSTVGQGRMAPSCG